MSVSRPCWKHVGHIKRLRRIACDPTWEDTVNLLG